MAERLITDDDLRRHYASARRHLGAPGAHVPEDAWVSLAEGSVAPETRAAYFDHILRCPDCTRVWQGLEALRQGAESEGLSGATSTGAGLRWMWSPAARYAIAASLVMGVAVGFWLGGRVTDAPAPDVVRSGASAATALAVGAVLDMEPGATAVARRAVTLLTCPAPPLGGAERLQASLASPSAQEVWTSEDVDPVSGRARIVADLTEAETGTWTVRLLRVDAAGRDQGATACRFELR